MDGPNTAGKFFFSIEEYFGGLGDDKGVFVRKRDGRDLQRLNEMIPMWKKKKREGKDEYIK